MDVLAHCHEGKDARWWAEQSAHWYAENERTARQRNDADAEVVRLRRELAGAVEERDQALETLGLLGWLYREATGHAPNPDDYIRARATAGGQ